MEWLSWSVDACGVLALLAWLAYWITAGRLECDGVVPEKKEPSELDVLRKQFMVVCQRLGYTRKSFGLWGVDRTVFDGNAEGALKRLKAMVEKQVSRIAVLECAAKGHVHRRTCAGDAARLPDPNGEWHYLKDSDAGFTGKALKHGTRTTVTCLDCDTVLLDDWEPKEVEDEA